MGPHWYHESQRERSRSPPSTLRSYIWTWAPLGALSFEGETHGTHTVPHSWHVIAVVPLVTKATCALPIRFLVPRLRNVPDRDVALPRVRGQPWQLRVKHRSHPLYAETAESCVLFVPSVRQSSVLLFFFSLSLSLFLSFYLVRSHSTIRMVYLELGTKTHDHTSLWIWLGEESFPFGASGECKRRALSGSWR